MCNCVSMSTSPLVCITSSLSLAALFFLPQLEDEQSAGATDCPIAGGLQQVSVDDECAVHHQLYRLSGSLLAHLIPHCRSYHTQAARLRCRQHRAAPHPRRATSSGLSRSTSRATRSRRGRWAAAIHPSTHRPCAADVPSNPRLRGSPLRHRINSMDLPQRAAMLLSWMRLFSM